MERNSIEREREREREGQKESKIRKKREEKGGNNGIPECVQLPFESVNLGESLGFLYFTLLTVLEFRPVIL